MKNSAALTLTITPLRSDTPVAGVPAETVTVTDGQWRKRHDGLKRFEVTLVSSVGHR
ncbi:hypothetical protein O9992_29510 [Vibrio lentus]|nr:hypothetical protein [Vibrio lentus]